LQYLLGIAEICRDLSIEPLTENRKKHPRLSSIVLLKLPNGWEKNAVCTSVFHAKSPEVIYL